MSLSHHCVKELQCEAGDCVKFLSTEFDARLSRILYFMKQMKLLDHLRNCQCFNPVHCNYIIIMNNAVT